MQSVPEGVIQAPESPDAPGELGLCRLSTGNGIFWPSVCDERLRVRLSGISAEYHSSLILPGLTVSDERDVVSPGLYFLIYTHCAISPMKIVSQNTTALSSATAPGITSPNWLLLPSLMNNVSASGRSILASFHSG